MGICGFAAGVAKYMLFFANAVAMMAAVAIIVIGVQMLQNLNIFADLFGRAFFPTPITVISIGATICVITFFGIFGTLAESRCMLLTYCTLLLLALLAEVAIGTYALLQYNNIDDYIDVRMKEFFETEYAEGSSSEFFDNIQERLHCCGLNGSSDFLPIFPGNLVPQSCCEPSATQCNQDNAFKLGCTAEMTHFVRDLFIFIGIITCSLAGVKVLALIVAMCLASRYRKSNYRHPQQQQPPIVNQVTNHQHQHPQAPAAYQHPPAAAVDMSAYEFHHPAPNNQQPITTYTPTQQPSPTLSSQLTESKPSITESSQLPRY